MEFSLDNRQSPTILSHSKVEQICETKAPFDFNLQSITMIESGGKQITRSDSGRRTLLDLGVDRGSFFNLNSSGSANTLDFLVKSLPPWEMTEGPLRDYLPNNVSIFINVMGLPSSNLSSSNWRNVSIAWACVVACSFLYFLGFELYLFSKFLSGSPSDSTLYVFERMVSYLAVLFQMAVEVPNILGLHSRLNQKAPIDDILVFTEFMPTALFFFVLCMFSVLAFPAVGMGLKFAYVGIFERNAAVTSTFYYTCMLLGECATCSYLSVSLIFQLVDIRSSSKVIEKLHLLGDSLSFEAFKACEEEIRMRKRASNWTDYMVGIALFNVVGFIVRIYEVEKETSEASTIAWLSAVAFSVKVGGGNVVILV